MQVVRKAMTPKKVLIVHTVVFGLFFIFSLSSPFVATYYSAFFSGYIFPGAIVFMPVVLIAWRFFGGCPFTVWENSLQKRINPALTYEDSCIQHYGFVWFGLKIPLSIIQPFLIALLSLPILVGLLLF